MFSWYEYKMEKDILKFGSWNQEKSVSFSKKAIAIDDVFIDKIIMSAEILCIKKGFEYFANNKNHEKVAPLCALLPENSGWICKKFWWFLDHVLLGRR